MSIVILLPRDINRFCRTCMNVTESNKRSFENYVILDQQPTDLSNILQAVTSLNVSPEDGLPETLCSVCMEHLTAAYTFIKQCKDINANLRNLLVLAEQNEEEEAGVLKECDNEMIDSIKSEQVDHVCQVCNETFTSYYQLSIHMIDHNKGKSLVERFFENQETKMAWNYEKSAELDSDTINLVKERRSSLKPKENKIKESVNLMEINDKTINDTESTKPSNKVECKMCTKKFKSRKDLISHICLPVTDEVKETSDPDRKLLLTTCGLCEKTFNDTWTLSLHFLKHALATTNIANTGIETEFFFCECCGETFDSESFLFKHYDEKHKGKPTWPCSTCSEIFEKESELLKHNSLVHLKRKLENSTTLESCLCVLCNAMFNSKQDLLKHSIEHLMKKYSCKKCMLSFCTVHAYSEHTKSHSTYQYTCSTCEKVLSSKSALKAHIVGVHSVELRHTCSTCGKSFATPSRLRTHAQIHKNTKKYVCTYCGYSAHKVGDLQIHTRTHTSERPYKCTFANCSASFKTSSHLCEHVRRHLQIRKFKCSICSASFSTSHTLKIHHLQHTGERPHSCLVCNQKFRRKYHVSVHMKQHQPKP